MMPMRVLILCAGLAGTIGVAAPVVPGPIIVGHGVVAGRAVAFLKVRLDAVRVKIGLAGGRPGRIEALDAIARRYGAVAAINGGDYEAYGNAPIRNPNHTLITGGGLMFKGDVGDVLWFDQHGRAAIDRVPLKIEGALDGRWKWPDNWYAYWINRLPSGTSDTITIFTPQWGERTGLAGGPQVQVADGVVTAIQNSSTIVPRHGFVVYFRGEAKAASHFAVGRTAQYRVVRASGTNDKAGSPLNLLRWVSPRTVKETFDPPHCYKYPFMAEEAAVQTDAPASEDESPRRPAATKPPPNTRDRFPWGGVDGASPG